MFRWRLETPQGKDPDKPLSISVHQRMHSLICVQFGSLNFWCSVERTDTKSHGSMNLWGSLRIVGFRSFLMNDWRFWGYIYFYPRSRPTSSVTLDQKYTLEILDVLHQFQTWFVPHKRQMFKVKNIKLRHLNSGPHNWWSFFFFLGAV